MVNILVVDEDRTCRHNIKYRLRDEGYSVTMREYLDAPKGNKDKYDLILLENREDLTPYCVEDLKSQFNCSVIMMAKAAQPDEIVECMKSGADDFVLKPIRDVELLAKVKYRIGIPKAKKQADEISGFLFDNSENMVSFQNNKVYLTKNEYRICKLLARNNLVTMTKERLYESIYEWDTDTQLRTITEYIYSLRRKFKEINIDPIKTVWGVGYRWIYERKEEEGKTYET